MPRPSARSSVPESSSRTRANSSKGRMALDQEASTSAPTCPGARPLGTVMARTEAAAAVAAALLRRACRVGASAPAPRHPVIERFDAAGAAA